MKTRIVEYLKEILGEDAGLEETKEAVLTHLTEIEQEAENLIEEQGFDYPVEVVVEKTYFPEKTYGDCTFPAGEYEALKVKIGSAKGQNWWCVLYPSLCFADALEPSMTEEGEEKLQQVLDEDAYDLLLHPQKLKIRFRLEFFLRNR
mgnify:CR=1 FL=1